MINAERPSTREQAELLVRYASDPILWMTQCVKIKPDDGNEYVPFQPWPAQVGLIEDFDLHDRICLLKTRQMGATTCTLNYFLWQSLVEKNSNMFLLSRQKGDTYVLIEKLRLVYMKLPDWLRNYWRLTLNNAGSLGFSNGSVFRTFASNKSACDGLTGSAVIDECDLIENLDKVLQGVAPAVAKGKLILLSRSNKDLPESRFKKIFRAAMGGENDFLPKFMPWWSRPDRDQKFYDTETRNSGSLDYMWSMYPESIDQALAPRQESKRIPLQWLESTLPPLDDHGLRQWPARIEQSELPATLAGVAGLRIYQIPQSGHTYTIGVDLASGRAESPALDDSALVILDEESRKQVAAYNAKIEPALMGQLVANLSRYYLMAGCLIELNGTFGGACIQYLKSECPDVKLCRGPAKTGLSKDVGFNTTSQSKIDLYERLADGARLANYHICDRQTFEQLASVEGRTLEAPPGLHDDLAMAAGFALFAIEEPGPEPFVIVSGPPEPPPPPKDAKAVDRSWASLGTFGVPQPPRRRGI